MRFTTGRKSPAGTGKIDTGIRTGHAPDPASVPPVSGGQEPFAAEAFVLISYLGRQSTTDSEEPGYETFYVNACGTATPVRTWIFATPNRDSLSNNT
jgi:hypothetical protein